MHISLFDFFIPSVSRIYLPEVAYQKFRFYSLLRFLYLTLTHFHLSVFQINYLCVCIHRLLRMAHVCIHWFRKGLRLHDNPALMAALKDCKELYPVFILDPYLHNTKVSINRWRFLIGALKDLDSSLRKLNSR